MEQGIRNSKDSDLSQLVGLCLCPGGFGGAVFPT